LYSRLVSGGRRWREPREGLHNEEVRNLFASPYLIRVNKSRRMRWEGHWTDKFLQYFGWKT